MKSFMQSRQARFSGYLALYLVIVIAALSALNWLANRHNKSFDLSSGKQYTLSDQTVKIVSGLKQDVTIAYYDQGSRFQQAKDLLSRYDNLSTKLIVEYIDPEKKPQVARANNVRTFGTVQVKSGDRSQEARSLTEEEITSALIRVLKTGERVACFVAGFGESAIDDTERRGYSGLKDLLERNNYKTQSVDFSEKQEFPKECTIVVVAGPRFAYPQPVADQIKKVVESGGRALIMAGQPEKPVENKPLEDLLGSWGVTLNNDNLRSPGVLAGPYLLSEVFVPANRYGTHPIVRDMKGSNSIFLFARSLEAKPGDKTSVEKIAFTPDKIDSTPVGKKETKTESFAVAAAGTFRTGEANKEGRFVVVGSADWASNSALGLVANRDLALNMFNWLSNDEDIISIRPKDPEDRRIQLNTGQMLTLRTVSQFLIPLAVIVAGVMVWWRRR